MEAVAVPLAHGAPAPGSRGGDVAGDGAQNIGFAIPINDIKGLIASVEKNGYFTRSFWMLEHYGTHLDAPIHFPPGKTSVDQIPVSRLFGMASVLDVRAEGAADADYELPVARIDQWENRHGQIPGSRCAAQDRLGVTLAGCAELPQRGRRGAHAFSGIFREGSGSFDRTQG